MKGSSSRPDPPRSSRYELLHRIAAGGMATVYVGRIRGAAGFSRLVAIKRAHGYLIEDPLFKRMLITEARLASRIHHPHVIAVLDVEEVERELFLVMDYVEGAALSKLLSRALQAGSRMPPGVAVRIALDACAGLHAAHELTGSDGRVLGIVHRDVSPHNILVGTDGIGRIADFGVAKCAQASSHATTSGALKGKVGYMAPEYVTERRIDARSDVFALGVVLWEALTNQRLFRDDDVVTTLGRIRSLQPSAPSLLVPELGGALDAVMARVLAKSPEARFQTALEFGRALEAAARPFGFVASAAEVGAYVRAHAGDDLARIRAAVRDTREAPLLDDDAAAADSGDASIAAPETEDLPNGAPADATSTATHVIARGPPIGASLENESSVPTDTVSASSARAGNAPGARAESPRRSVARRAIVVALVTAAGVGGFMLARVRQGSPIPAPAGAPIVETALAAPAAEATSAPPAVSPPASTASAESIGATSAPADARIGAARTTRPSSSRQKGPPPFSRSNEPSSAGPPAHDEKAPPNPY